MSKIQQFNKANLAVLRDDMNKALAEIATKHGIQLKVGNCRFFAQTASFKVEAAALASNDEGEQVAETRERSMLKLYFPEMVDKVYTRGLTQPMKIVGYNTRGKRYPLLAIGQRDGKRYKLPESIRELG